MSNPSVVYKVDNISFSYGPITCIKNTSLQLNQPCFYGLIGPNGSGKSTLLDLLSGHLFADVGSIYFYGRDIHTYPRKQLARKLTTVPQSFSLNFDYSVEEVVLMGRYPYIERFAKPKKSDLVAVEEALHNLDIYHLRSRKVTQLSGGEKQRVMIARSLAQDTDIILLDEVTSNLDVNHAVSIMKVMRDIVDTRQKTVLAALHDLNIAAAFCDELIVIRDGEIAESGDSSEVLSEHLIDDLYQIKSTISKDHRTEKKHIQFHYL